MSRQVWSNPPVSHVGEFCVEEFKWTLRHAGLTVLQFRPPRPKRGSLQWSHFATTKIRGPVPDVCTQLADEMVSMLRDAEVGEVYVGPIAFVQLRKPSLVVALVLFSRGVNIRLPIE